MYFQCLRMFLYIAYGTGTKELLYLQKNDPDDRVGRAD